MKYFSEKTTGDWRHVLGRQITLMLHLYSYVNQAAAIEHKYEKSTQGSRHRTLIILAGPAHHTGYHSVNSSSSQLDGTIGCSLEPVLVLIYLLQSNRPILVVIYCMTINNGKCNTRSHVSTERGRGRKGGRENGKKRSQISQRQRKTQLTLLAAVFFFFVCCHTASIVDLLVSYYNY